MVVDGEDHNDARSLAAAIAPAGPNPKVVVEATYGWYWAADVLEECGAEVHLAHPLGMKGITSHRRVKNDVKDAVLLADLLRLGSLPEAYIAPRGLRELRELVRYRAKLVSLRANLKSQVHAGMAKEGVLPTRTDMFGLVSTPPLSRSRSFTESSIWLRGVGLVDGGPVCLRAGVE